MLGRIGDRESEKERRGIEVERELGGGGSGVRGLGEGGGREGGVIDMQE